MTTPPNLGRRAHTRCRRYPTLDGEPIPDAPIGTIAESTDGEVVLFIGDSWPNELIDIPALAARYRGARLITLIGDTYGAGRPCQRALHDAWNAQNQARLDAVRATRPPRPIKASTALCGQPRRDGQPCRQIAGLGTDTPGVGPCRDHGGSTAQQDAARRALDEHLRTYSRLHDRKQRRPLSLREQLDEAIALREILLAAEAKCRRNRR